MPNLRYSQILHETKHCYLCGVELFAGENQSRDHCPPAGIFAHPLPNNLVTVPCCKKHNNSKSQDEEFVRFFLTSSYHQTPEAKLIYDTRTLLNSLKGGRLSKKLPGLLDTARKIVIRDGEDRKPAIQMGFPSNILYDYAERIARGLTLEFNPSLEATIHTLEFTAFLPPPKRMFQLLREFSGCLKRFDLGGRAFQSFHGTIQGDVRYGVWIMNFHELLGAVVLHQDPAQSRWDPRNRYNTGMIC